MNWYFQITWIVLLAPIRTLQIKTVKIYYYCNNKSNDFCIKFPYKFILYSSRLWKKFCWIIGLFLNQILVLYYDSMIALMTYISIQIYVTVTIIQTLIFYEQRQFTVLLSPVFQYFDLCNKNNFRPLAMYVCSHCGKRLYLIWFTVF